MSCLQIRISTNVLLEQCLGEIGYLTFSFYEKTFFSLSENSDLALIN